MQQTPTPSEAAIVGRLIKPDHGDFSPEAARGCGKTSWRTQPVGRSWVSQYSSHWSLWVRASSAMIASALSLSHRIPEPFSRAVSVLHVASVGPLPICHPLDWNWG